MKQSGRSRLPVRFTLAQQLLDSLGQAIVLGDYDDIANFTEAQISEQYNTSRSITREAVKMLVAKGMVSIRPRNGITVLAPRDWSLLDPDVLRWMLERKFSPELLRHFTEMRLALEPTAAAIVAHDVSATALRNIERGLQRMIAAEKGDDDALEADIEFHVAILNATGNPFFQQLDELVATALKISIRLTNRIKGSTASVPAHRRVYEAIAAGDADAARAAMATIISEALVLISDRRATGRKSSH